MSWERVGDSKPVSDVRNGKSIFMKIAPGDKVSGVFVGSPKIFYSKWANGTVEKSDEPRDGFKFRFKSNFAVQENGAWVMKVFEQGKTIYEDLVSLVENGYKLDETLVTIHRVGSGMETRYSVVPAAPGPQAEVNFTALGCIEQHDLSGKPKEDKQPSFGDVPF